MPTPDEQFAFFLRLSNPADLSKSHFMILDEPCLSTFNKASYFEANALIHFEVDGQKYGVKQFLKVSQILNSNSIFHTASGHRWEGSQIYNTNLQKVLSSLDTTLDQISLSRRANISDDEYLSLKKKKAMLMFLKGQLVEIFDVRTVTANNQTKRQTQWRIVDIEDLRSDWDIRIFSKAYKADLEDNGV